MSTSTILKPKKRNILNPLNAWRIFSQKGLNTGISSSPQHEGLSILGSQNTDPEQLQKDFGCCCLAPICTDETTLSLPQNYQDTNFFGWFPQAPGHTYENPQVAGRTTLPIEIFFNYAPDKNCVEDFSHPNGIGGRSAGTFRCTFTLTEAETPTTIYIRVEGPTEAQSANFDKSTLRLFRTGIVDEEVNIYGFSYGLGCKMLDTWMAKKIYIDDAGEYSYTMTTDTRDSLYHPASYHKFTIKHWEGEEEGEYRPPKP